VRAGTPIRVGLIQANIALALERPEIADSVRAFIRNIR